jgi:hypothetical protein
MICPDVIDRSPVSSIPFDWALGRPSGFPGNYLVYMPTAMWDT